MQTIEKQASSNDLTPHRPSLKALTGIRFFASFYVVVFHSRLSSELAQHGQKAAGHFFASGYLAVELFFLLSGFILAYTYAGQLKVPSDTRRFLEARFARIWPVYAVSLLLASIPSLVFPKPWVMVATLAMVQAWNPLDAGMAGAWNLVCWTLSVEAVFYLCFPSFQVWIERQTLRSLQITIAGMLLLTIALNSGIYTLGVPLNSFTKHVPMPLWHLSEFFAGVGMGNFFERRRGLGKAFQERSRVFGSGVWTYVSALLTIALLCRAQSRWTSVVVLAFAALIFGLASEATWLSRLLSTRIMLLGGGMSYSMYLMQMPVKAWGNGLADRFHVGSSALRLGFSTAILLVLSLFLFKVVEDPARRLIRSAFATIEQQRQRRSALSIAEVKPV